MKPLNIKVSSLAIHRVKTLHAALFHLILAASTSLAGGQSGSGSGMMGTESSSLFVASQDISTDGWEQYKTESPYLLSWSDLTNQKQEPKELWLWDELACLGGSSTRQSLCHLETSTNALQDACSTKSSGGKGCTLGKLEMIKLPGISRISYDPFSKSQVQRSLLWIWLMWGGAYHATSGGRCWRDSKKFSHPLRGSTVCLFSWMRY